MALQDAGLGEVVAPRAVAAARGDRILVYGINYAPEPTGVGRFTGELGAYLAKCGDEVEVVTGPPHYPGWTVRDGYRNRFSVERLGGARVTRCPMILTSNMRGLWRLLAPLSFAISSAPVAAWRILTTRPDTVLCVVPTLLSAPIAVIAARLVGARTVVHVQDLEVDAAFATGHLKGGALKRVALAFERVVLSAFASVVTISQRMEEQLKRKSVAGPRLKIVRNWVDLGKIAPRDAPSPYRDELGIAPTTFVALYAGNIGAKQGLSAVLDAARRLTDAADISFVIAGEGPEKAELMERSGDLANIRFLPTQPEHRLCDLLNLADVHLLPQEAGAADFALPSKLGGMLASGKPAIVMADPHTELYEFLGRGAILVPTGDSEKLAQAIRGASEGGLTASLEDNSERIAALDAHANLPALRAILARAG